MADMFVAHGGLHRRRSGLLAQTRGVYAVSSLPGRRLAHWVGDGRKCQQAGHANAPQRTWNALGARSCQSHAGIAHHGVQRPVGSKLARSHLSTHAATPAETHCSCAATSARGHATLFLGVDALCVSSSPSSCTSTKHASSPTSYHYCWLPNCQPPLAAFLEGSFGFAYVCKKLTNTLE